MKILQLISSPVGPASFSTQLSEAIVANLTAAHPESTVTVRDLTAPPFPHLEEVHLQSFFTPEQDHSPAQREAIRHSNAAIAELMAADTIVIGTPMYSFTVATVLKSWIDHISRAGITFRYTESGPEGLVKGKKVYIAMASGGVYSSGPMAAYDFVAPYLRTILGFLGMTDVEVHRVEGTNLPELRDQALAKAIAGVEVAGVTV